MLTTSAFRPPQPAPAPAQRSLVLHERWPTLAAAMGQYQQNLAEEFSRRAYDCVHQGLITGSDRRRLAHEADELGLRPFDAQLLIACAIRQWSLDRPQLIQHRAARSHLKLHRPIARRRWYGYAIIGVAALAIDTAIVMLWLR